MIIIEWQMGGNGAFNKALGRVRGHKRTHQEYHDRIDGHKILLLNINKSHVKLPVNSNSESPIYLGGKVLENGNVIVTTVGIYQNHKCIGQMDLKFDEKGNYIPFSIGDGNSSHYHYFVENPLTGEIRRKSHDKSNTYPIDDKYLSLIFKIVEYNKSKY